MSQEIERKFLVSGDYRRDEISSYRIRQGYICSQGGRTVRVRLCDDRGFLTIKGPSLDGGLSRFEWEIEITSKEALDLFELCNECVEKIRHMVPFGGHTFEVDEFLGDNAGLVVAELELSAVDEHFDKPSWLGQEVTGDKKYYNTALSHRPYCSWNK